MKKVFLILVAVFVVLVGFSGVFIGYAAIKGEKLDASSKAYVEKNVPPIISPWSATALTSRASPELLQSINQRRAHFDQSFKKLTRLGSLQHLGKAQGHANVSYTNNHDKMTTASYAMDATFTHGNATIEVRLIRISGHWSIRHFGVVAPLFYE